MKRYILITLLVVSTVFTSCNDWLDISPKDQIGEDKLFSTGDGYRNALNGVYSNISSSQMYAKEFSWGFMDVLAQYYDKWSLNYDSSYKKYVVNYDYDNAFVKGVLDNFWRKAYTNIANCNNLIQNIENEDPASFAGGELEKNMIHGEALALRAFLHFDLLRIFAPAPNNDDGNVYIPYCEKHPAILIAKETVPSCLQKIERDLLRAKRLLSTFDLDPDHINWLQSNLRIMANGGSQANGLPEDLFYLYRGFRMNYYATTAVLSRVYAYRGALKEAYGQADEVYKAEDSNGARLFSLTSYSRYAKYYEETLFALSNKKVTDYFEPYYTGTQKSLSLQADAIFGNETSDSRYQDILQVDGWPRAYISKKYINTGNSTFRDDIVNELIPMVKLTEMYYIMGEYLYSEGRTEDAKNILKEIRISRGVTSDFPEEISSMDDYKRELLRDATKDFIGEGQLFYMYKRFGVKISTRMDMEDFVFDIPDSEIIN